VVLPIGVGSWVGLKKLPAILEQAKQKNQAQTTNAAARHLPSARDSIQVRQDLDRVGRFLIEEAAAHRGLPTNSRDLWSIWKVTYPGERLPREPYDSTLYGYYRTRDGFVLWSSGPDEESDTEDDIIWRYPARIAHR
jgi:hypothetical protein